MVGKDRTEELLKIKILARLNEPENLHNGLVGSEATIDARVRQISSDRLLSEMVKDGLIERRNVKSHKTARPYFITQAGRGHLAAAIDSALSGEMEPTSDWASRHRSNDVKSKIEDVLSSLPEFRNSEIGRVDEVAQKIMTSIALTTQR